MLVKKSFRIPIAKPVVTEEDIALVVEALRGGHLSSGEYVERFEQEFAKYIGTKHAVAVNSGTAALEVSLKAMGVSKGDEVITPSFTIAATSNAVVSLGAKPVFVEIERETYNMNPSKVEDAITPRTKALMPIHYGGQCAEMNQIMEIASRHNLKVVEDGAPAAGATYRGSKAGTFGDAAGFSFFPDKNITTGEGGMITTNEDQIAEKARYLRKHGAPSRYYNVDIGWNYKMPDFCAALGLSQLARLEATIRRKNEVAQNYSKLLRDMSSISLPLVRPYNRHTFMLYAIRTEDNNMRERIRSSLESIGVETRINFPPVHLQPIYKSMYGYGTGLLPLTEQVSETIISLPIFLQMTDEDQTYIVDAIRNIAR